jgi:serine protease Do
LRWPWTRRRPLGETDAGGAAQQGVVDSSESLGSLFPPPPGGAGGGSARETGAYHPGLFEADAGHGWSAWSEAAPATDGPGGGPGMPPLHRRRHPRGRGWRRTAAVGLIGVLVGAGAVVALEPTYHVLADTVPQVQTVSLSQTQEAAGAPAVAVYQKLGPSVVLVTSQSTVSSFYGTQNQTAWGSGVIFSSDGYIVTNDHVVEGSQSVTVTLPNGNSYTATVVGGDPSTDLAVLKISPPSGVTLPAAPFANSSDVVPGEVAIAIGNPLGPQFSHSVTQGIVSAIRPMLYGLNNSAPRVTTLIQTDASINPGNSGGALANAQGEVIGITSMKVPQTGESSVPASGLGFAIPSNTVVSVANQLIRYGYVKRSWLGVVIQPSPSNALPNQPQTLAVTSVVAGSPADKAGIMQGDAIVSLSTTPGGTMTPMNNYYKLVEALNKTQPGQTISLGLDRDGQTVTVNVTLGQEPRSEEQPTAQPQVQPPTQPSPSQPGIPFPCIPGFFGC